MKKVFRTWKFEENMRKIFGLSRGNKEVAISLNLGWPQKCEGKTKEEVEGLGLDYCCDNAWMVEENA